MRRGSGTILSGQPRVRLRYATAPARPSRQNGSCSPEENHIETTTNQGAKSVTDVPGRNCNRCARTLIFDPFTGGIASLNPRLPLCDSYGVGAILVT